MLLVHLFVNLLVYLERIISQAVFKVEVHGEKLAGVDFATASIADMPPRLRVVFEENKVRGMKPP